MRKHALLIGIACLAANSASLAFNPVQGWYAGGIGLVSYAPSLTFDVATNQNSTTVQGEIDYRVGGGGGGLIGYRCAPWRLEGEVVFNINTYSRLTVGGVEIKRLNDSNQTSALTLKGETYYIAGMINAYYDLYQVQFSRDSQIVPYVGIGAGYAELENEIKFYNQGVLVSSPTTVTINGTTLIVSSTSKESSSEAALQFIIGAQYFADDFTSVGIDYRYFTTGKLTNSNERFVVHTANLTLNFAFDSTDYYK